MDSTTPLFAYTEQDFVCEVDRASGEPTTHSKFDLALRSGWKEAMSRGLFRYHLGELETRVLSGEAGYIAQLNIQRGIERRKPQEILSIRQKFDPKQFNFNKINPEEVLFEICRADPRSAESCHQNGATTGSCMVIINVSPLEFGHSLLVPEPARCYPQILIPLAVQVGIESVFLSADPGYRVGFNSLGAFASVNHLHLHGYYLNHTLRVEWAPTEPLVPEKCVYRLTGFPSAFMLYTEGQDPAGTAAAVCRLTDILVDRNIAHNVFMCRGCPPSSEAGPSGLRRGVRVCIWPRVSCFGSKEESAFNVALCELAGHLPFKNREDFNNIDEDGVKAIVQRYVLNDQHFTDLQQVVVGQLWGGLAK
ncbi:GDP-D-glucose phosphorylase 1 [Salminus brasiliensis]|uniref:GDP-D-glucose phosphorylase 1 n=1 Tax=Salminus brasiliensis TaxID=930266 RepID=UPI003B838B7E